MFESLQGELYNADRERRFSFSPAYPRHLFLHSSSAPMLHQSVEWFKLIKENQFVSNKLFLICGSLICYIQHLNSFLWSSCWKHSSVSSLVMANNSTHMLKLPHCSDHQQVVGSCHAVALGVPVHLAHAKGLAGMKLTFFLVVGVMLCFWFSIEQCW